MRKLFLFFIAITIIYACKKDSELAIPSTQNTSLTLYKLTIPLGLPPIYIPDSLKLTEQGVALGKQLFYDPILSANGQMSCGSCHHQLHAFVDTGKLSIGIDGIAGTRNAMPLFNLAYATNFFWDGGATSIENQVIGPIQNPVEMHSTLKNVIEKLNNNNGYKTKFKLVFGKSIITTAMLMKAIAQFEKTILSGNSKYDLYKVGKATLTSHEANGLNIFIDNNKGDCTHCHILGSTFTDFDFKDNGLDSIPKDSGRYRIPPFLVSNIGKFKTPSLRNIELTAPYMHDGRFKTLTECVEHYNSGFKNSPNLDINIANKTKGRMSTQEVADVVAFLKTLTDNSITTNKNFAQ
ncbi:MAG: hypothetical protein RL708_247 [Bacteroidota bacterium]|jgi:cytochrome c peroxidase